MKQQSVVEIGSGNAAQCSRRILLAFKTKSLPTLRRELARAERVCQAAPESSLAAEQVELLEAVVGSMRMSISGRRPCDHTEISLLGHLAGSV
jgi:hypothetical protein